MNVEYQDFLARKTQISQSAGFTPAFLPSCLFDFQRSLVSWAAETGRAAIFADCGLGKTLMQLVWAQNVVEKTNGRVLILTPIAVGAQTTAEADRFGIQVARSRDGVLPDARIVVSNYEQLHRFDTADFVAVVCDESSILKHFSGATQKAVTRFMLKIPYRLLCTATAAPNDWSELGTSSEALGVMGYTDMLSRFFTQSDNVPHRMQQIESAKGNHYRVSQQIGLWRLKGHAEVPFWRWVASWAKACRKPSDMGYRDGAFILPPLTEREHVVKARRLPDGCLFPITAIGFHAEREERRRTITERCEAAASLASHAEPAIIYCQLNTEGNLLERMIPDSVQVAGADSDEEKEERFMAFIRGDAQARVLVSKAKIAGFGLNFQHCAHVLTFVTHSYESYYQSVRRCWRFGQRRPVVVDVIATEGEARVAANLSRKAAQADAMFTGMMEHMHSAESVNGARGESNVEVPSWLNSRS